jgi:hypothetical protein
MHTYRSYIHTYIHTYIHYMHTYRLRSTRHTWRNCVNWFREKVLFQRYGAPWFSARFQYMYIHKYTYIYIYVCVCIHAWRHVYVYMHALLGLLLLKTKPSLTISCLFDVVGAPLPAGIPMYILVLCVWLFLSRIPFSAIDHACALSCLEVRESIRSLITGTCVQVFMVVMNERSAYIELVNMCTWLVTVTNPAIRMLWVWGAYKHECSESEVLIRYECAVSEVLVR